jgi:hypothetical protein
MRSLVGQRVVVALEGEQPHHVEGELRVEGANLSALKEAVDARVGELQEGHEQALEILAEAEQRSRQGDSVLFGVGRTAILMDPADFVSATVDPDGELRIAAQGEVTLVVRPA